VPQGDYFFKLFSLFNKAPSASEGFFKQTFLKGLILAQNERWRRGLGMQVEREPLGNWWGKWRKGQ
jgi:hypothetical protein